jgi:uncharacterized protein (TIGR00269 family)
MRCRICRQKAEIELPMHNISLCREHFISFVERRVEKAIKKYNMFSKKDTVLLAVSGGKDSLVLWYILAKLGYKVIAYFINLGIPNFSEEAYKKIIAFKEKFGGNLIVDNLKEELYGMDIKEVAKIYRSSVCSICGTFKRYKINQKGMEVASVIATGHNLDDETATLLSNIMHWQISYIERQGPVLERYKTLQKKVKPLILLTEREIMAYAFFQEIDYLDKPCPYSSGATSRYYKKSLSLLECNMPGTKLQFFTNFLKNKHLIQSEKKETVNLVECVKCGYITSSNICKVCRIKEKVVSFLKEK